MSHPAWAGLNCLPSQFTESRRRRIFAPKPRLYCRADDRNSLQPSSNVVPDGKSSVVFGVGSVFCRVRDRFTESIKRVKRRNRSSRLESDSSENAKSESLAVSFAMADCREPRGSPGHCPVAGVRAACRRGQQEIRGRSCNRPGPRIRSFGMKVSPKRGLGKLDAVDLGGSVTVGRMVKGFH